MDHVPKPYRKLLEGKRRKPKRNRKEVQFGQQIGDRSSNDLKDMSF